MSDPKVSVVLSTRNRATFLEPALRSHERCDWDEPWELVVVDNGSTDATPELLRAFERSASIRVRVLTEPRPGLSAARNTGWRAAGAGLVAFTDDDCYPRPDFVRAVAACFADPAIGYLGGRILLHDPEDAPVTIQLRAEPLRIAPRSFVPAGLIQGANMAARREVLEALGGFDERLGAGTPFPSEDLDFVSRASALGWAGAYDPRPIVEHHHRRRSEAELDRLRRGYDLGRGAYYAKCLLDPKRRNPTWRVWLKSLVRDALASPRSRRAAARIAGEMKGAFGYWRAHDAAGRDMSAEPVPVATLAPEDEAPPEPRRGIHVDWLLLAVPALFCTLAWVAFLADRAPHTAAALVGFPLDDAWIHMVYGRALALEGGFNYNAGVPETGMTSPLWAVLVAGLHLVLGRAGVPALVVSAKALALACGIAGAWVFAALARHTGLSRGGALLAASLFALDPALTFSRAAGMEVPLFTALVLAALVLAARDRPLAAGASVGLAIVARPEGVLLVPVIAAMLAWGMLERRAARPSARRLALAALLAALPALLEAAYCLHATGAPLPNTFYAKYSGTPVPTAAELSMVWRNYVTGSLPYFTFGAGIWIALLGVWGMLQYQPRATAGTIAAGILLFVATVGSRSFAPGHFHYWERWLLPALPMLLLAIAAGVDQIARGLPGFRRGTHDSPRPARRPPFLAAAGLVTLLLMAPWSRVFVGRADEFAWNCQNIEEMNVATGKWIATHLPRNAVVASCDAGAVRYFGQRTTLDVLGLNSHRLLHAGLTGAVAELGNEGARWLVVFPPLFGDLLRSGESRPVFAARAPHYTVCEAPQDVLAVFAWNPRRPTGGPR